MAIVKNVATKTSKDVLKYQTPLRIHNGHNGNKITVKIAMTAKMEYNGIRGLGGLKFQA